MPLGTPWRQATAPTEWVVGSCGIVEEQAYRSRSAQLSSAQPASTLDLANGLKRRSWHGLLNVDEYSLSKVGPQCILLAAEN